MADDLQDEWWNSDEDDKRSDGSEEEGISNNDKESDQDKSNLEESDNAVSKSSKKRKLNQSDGDKKSAAKKSRKRPKKKRITEVTLTEGGDSPDVFRKAIEEFYAGKLSAVERDAIALSDNHFGPTNCDLSHTVTSFLKEALPKWQKLKSAHSQKMAPLVLLLSANANRSLVLNRDSGVFKGDNCKTAKLFARHLKPEAQAKFLESNVVHFAIGTPARVASLLAQVIFGYHRVI
ncbi:uncharacterized protein C3orf26 homolog isoform X2 [Styela clava]